MPKLPLCSSREAVHALTKAGFVLVRKTPGSHAFFKRVDKHGTRVVIVVLGKREIPRGTLKSIIAQSGIDAEEFIRLAKGR